MWRNLAQTPLFLWRAHRRTSPSGVPSVGRGAPYVQSEEYREHPWDPPLRALDPLITRALGQVGAL